MTRAEWSVPTGGIEHNIKFNPKSLLPKKAHYLPEDSVLIKVAYATVNPADYKFPDIPILNRIVFSKPATPGLDCAGTVIKSTRSDLKPGDHVAVKFTPTSEGTLAEYIVAQGKEVCAKIPEGVSLEQASALGVCGLTSYQCIAPYVKDGSKVLINGGSGGTGTFGIQIAKNLGCYVTATCSGANADLCKSLGADEVIDYRTTDVVSQLKRSGTQYDLIVDNVFTPDIYWNSADYLKPNCYYITPAGDAKWSVIWSLLQILLLPSWLGGGSRPAKFAGVQPKAQDFTTLGGWMAERKLKTVIEKTYNLKETGEALARQRTGHVRGKLVVEVTGDS